MPPRRSPRGGFTLVELLVVIGVVGVLASLTLAAVQQARAAAGRAKCQHNLRQLALALHHHADDRGHLPPGHRPPGHADAMAFSGWSLSAFPYLEQASLFEQARAEYRLHPNPFGVTPHATQSAPVPAFACPADGRVPGPRISEREKRLVALMSFLGISGRDESTLDGVLFHGSRVVWADVTDGTSNTLLLGERPPSADLQFGWVYAGLGQAGRGSADLTLGVRERNLLAVTVGSPCGPGMYSFRPSRFDDQCGMFHFWSPHSSGANFAFADGSVRFLAYSAAPLLPALASRAAGDAAD